MPCDADCVKIIIDTGMATLAATKMYAPALDLAGVTGSSRTVVDFYVASVELFTERAQELNEKKLTEEQRAKLTAQIQKMCYRADDLVKWSCADTDTIREKARVWRDEILAWAKDDQTVFTALVAEVGDPK